MCRHQLYRHSGHSDVIWHTHKLVNSHTGHIDVIWHTHKSHKTSTQDVFKTSTQDRRHKTSTQDGRLFYVFMCLFYVLIRLFRVLIRLVYVNALQSVLWRLVLQHKCWCLVTSCVDVLKQSVLWRLVLQHKTSRPFQRLVRLLCVSIACVRILY